MNMARSRTLAKDGAASLPAEQKAQVHEVADLMLEIYETLVKMRYVEPQAIIRGPHTFDQNQLNTFDKLKLDPAVIYLYRILPYIDPMETEARDFFQGGAFFNHMETREVERGRDPFYASPKDGFEDEDGEYMHPWFTPLSNCGNHSPIMIYDAREHRIWIADQIDRRTTDPVYCKGWYRDVEAEEEEKSDWGGSGSSNWSEDRESDLDSQGSSEFWDDEDNLPETEELAGLTTDQAEDVSYDEGFEYVEELSEWEREEAAAVKNRNSLVPVRNRHAGDVLRDINRWYIELKELPGQGEYSGWLRPEVLRPLYLKNGWPDKFDGDQFEVDMARAYCVERARYFAEEPLRKVECHEGWAKHSDWDIERYTKQVSEAKTPDEEWHARFEVWKAKERSERNARDLKEAKEKAERKCPSGICQKDEDLPLWELEQLRVETQWKRESAERQVDVNRYKDDPIQLRSIDCRHRRAQHQLAVYEKAFEAAQAEAERLCPGKTFQTATGRKSLGRRDTLSEIATQQRLIEYFLGYLQDLRGFADTVPIEAASARDTVDKEILRNEGSLKGCRESLARSEKWLAEHGNTD